MLKLNLTFRGKILVLPGVAATALLLVLLVTFALGDASVRPIAMTIDPVVLRSISGMADGDSMLVP